MAKKRHEKYSLSETMADVQQNIEGAKAEAAPAVQPLPIETEPVIVPVEAVTTMPIAETKEEEVPVKSPTLLPAETPSEKITDNNKPTTPPEKKKRGKKTEAPVIDSDVTGKSYLRNVELDEETLWRLEAVKDKLNRAREEGDSYVTQKTIMRTAMIEWLDRHFPATKEAYHIINNLG